jgi:hypothetical protein
MIGGSVLGLLGSIVGATAKDIPALIAAETLIGLGASAQISFACKFDNPLPVQF